MQELRTSNMENVSEFRSHINGISCIFVHHLQWLCLIDAPTYQDIGTSTVYATALDG